MSRPQLHIFHSYVSCDIKCTKQCKLKLLSDVRRRTGPVSSRQGNELDRIDPYFFIRYFFGWLADFLVGDAQECRPIKVKAAVRDSSSRTALACALLSIFYPKEKMNGKRLHELDIIEAITGMCNLNKNQGHEKFVTIASRTDDVMKI